MPSLATPTPVPTAAPLEGCQSNPIQGLCTAVQNVTGGSSSVVGPLVQHVMAGLIIFVLVVIGGRLLLRVVRGAIERAGGDRQVANLARSVISILTWVFAVLGGLVGGGLDATYVFTFGGIFGVALGLALQDVLRNILAGIFILMEKPFTIGDTIRVGDQSGEVRTILLRTTELATGDGRVAVIPNLLVFSSAVVVGSPAPVRSEKAEEPSSS